MDTIALLPDAIANQIAAGEVIQRPSSVVKELLENSVDAGAAKIQLSIKSAGKQLIQVIDNGSGMSDNDARMAFERHATSKISKPQDLFALRTMGFRGEALASIASIAQVTLRTRQEHSDMGTRLEISDSQVQSKTSEVVPVGTQIEVKNLFFNIPARRKFLKKDTTEFKHIVDEFMRVALAFPEVHFQLYNEDKLLHNLEKGTTQHRALSILGRSWESKLIPIAQKTDYVSIKGYVGKPDKATKSKSNQYFIVNDRYIRSGYLHHAVQRAFEGLIAPDQHPAYVIYIELDPEHIDVNVHPTKQEIKFDDERVVYSFLHSTVKHSLGKYSIQPAIDFDIDRRYDELDALRKVSTPSSRAHLKNTTIFQTFQNKNEAHKIHRSAQNQNWQQVLDIKLDQAENRGLPEEAESNLDLALTSPDQPTPKQSEGVAFEIGGGYIVSTLRSELLLIRKQRAQQRLVYERLMRSASQDPLTQQLTVPIKFATSAGEDAILQQSLDLFTDLGFDISAFGHMEYIIHAVPHGVVPSSADEVVLQALREAEDSGEIELDSQQSMCHALAQSMLRKSSKLSTTECNQLISELFSLPDPMYTADGRKIFELIKPDRLEIFIK